MYPAKSTSDVAVPGGRRPHNSRLYRARPRGCRPPRPSRHYWPIHRGRPAGPALAADAAASRARVTAAAESQDLSRAAAATRGRAATTGRLTTAAVARLAIPPLIALEDPLRPTTLVERKRPFKCLLAVHRRRDGPQRSVGKTGVARLTGGSRKTSPGPLAAAQRRRHMRPPMSAERLR